MPERANKTIMCSVLFLDIPNYSRMSVSGQIELKERINGYLSGVIAHVPLADRIVLDTGDGAAINFLGDVEDAFKVALALDECIHEADPEIEPHLSLRMGVNLGPVRLTSDINGQPNIVGDGINVAQRIMAFADIGQILVSRSYYEAVSRISPTYAKRLHHLGMRTDKHVREHEIYAVVAEGHTAPTRKLQSRQGKAQSVVQYWNRLAAHLDGMVDRQVQRIGSASMMGRIAYVGVALVPLLLLGAAVWKFWLPMHDSSSAENLPPVPSVNAPEQDDKPWYKDVLSSKPTKGEAQIVVRCAPGSQVYVDGESFGRMERNTLNVPVSAGANHTVIVTDPTGDLHTDTLKLSIGQTRQFAPRGCK